MDNQYYKWLKTLLLSVILYAAQIGSVHARSHFQDAPLRNVARHISQSQQIWLNQYAAEIISALHNRAATHNAQIRLVHSQPASDGKWEDSAFNQYLASQLTVKTPYFTRWKSSGGVVDSTEHCQSPGNDYLLELSAYKKNNNIYVTGAFLKPEQYIPVSPAISVTKKWMGSWSELTRLLKNQPHGGQQYQLSAYQALSPKVLKAIACTLRFSDRSALQISIQNGSPESLYKTQLNNLTEQMILDISRQDRKFNLTSAARADVQITLTIDKDNQGSRLIVSVLEPGQNQTRFIRFPVSIEIDNSRQNQTPPDAHISVLTPKNLSDCMTKAPWESGIQTWSTSKLLPQFACYALQVSVPDSAQFALLARSEGGELQRLLPSSCYGYSERIGEKLQFPPEFERDNLVLKSATPMASTEFILLWKENGFNSLVQSNLKKLATPCGRRNNTPVKSLASLMPDLNNLNINIEKTLIYSD